jgi:hypothetical protein
VRGTMRMNAIWRNVRRRDATKLAIELVALTLPKFDASSSTKLSSRRRSSLCYQRRRIERATNHTVRPLGKDKSRNQTRYGQID